MADEWIDIKIAKTLLSRTCKFLQPDDSGIADFILTGKEALILSIYSSAFFIINERYRWKLRPVAGLFSQEEPLETSLIDKTDKIYFPYISISEKAPIFSECLSSYLKFIPNWNKEKRLLLVDASSPTYRSRRGNFYENRMIEDICNRIKSTGLNFSDFIIWCSKDDSTFGEDFWEYLSGVIFRDKGYFVTFSGGGDISAYLLPDYQKKLKQAGIITRGAFLEELEILDKIELRANSVSLDPNNYELICIEAESSKKRTKSHSKNAGVGQVLKALLDGYYTHAFVAGPFCEDSGDPKVGIISCDRDGNLIYKKGEEYRESREEDVKTIKELIKRSLLRRFSFEKRCRLLGLKGDFGFYEYYEKVMSLEIDSIIEMFQSERKVL